MENNFIETLNQIEMTRQHLIVQIKNDSRL